MTREEAIDLLDTLIGMVEDSRNSDYDTAFKMGIKALEQEPILDKIKAEIEQLRLHKAQFLTNDNKVCIDSQKVLEIIDKYKAESEDKGSLC